MSSFSSKFKKQLLEAVEDEFDIDFEDEAAKDEALGDFVDSDTDPSDFEAEAIDTPETDEIAAAMDRKNQEMINTLQSWIDEVDGFLEYINGEHPESIQSVLAGAESDTILDKMKQSQQTKIARVASDLASLHQSFLGFMAQTKNAKFKYV